MSDETDVLQGTLDLLILRTIALSRARFYSLTRAGRQQVEVAKWERLSAGVNFVLQRT